MSKKRKNYSVGFKVKLVLEVLEEDKKINEIASKFEVLPVGLKNWKKQFLENMSLAFDKSTVVKEYKDEIEVLQREKKEIDQSIGVHTSTICREIQRNQDNSTQAYHYPFADTKATTRQQASANIHSSPFIISFNSTFECQVDPGAHAPKKNSYLILARDVGKIMRWSI